jgi:tetratricopeptide (TPR) repeat protein
VGQLTRWCRRHQALSSAILLAIVLAGMVGIFAYQAQLSRYQAHLSEKALAVERLDRAVTEAMLVAMSGDEETTLRKIEEAELLGAETWVASLLRGQVSLFAHRYDDAFEHLNHALKLKPESIEIKALLGKAAWDSRNFNEFEHLEVELSSAVPVTTRDKLFLGHFLSGFDPQRGLSMLMEAKRKDNSGESNIARLFLAQARTYLAFDTFDVETALQAVEEADIARRLMPDNIVAWVMEFRALLVAVKVMRTANREDDANELNARSLNTLERIDQFPDSILVALAWWWQGLASDNPVERLRALERSISVLKNLSAHEAARIVESYALELYLSSGNLEAKQVLSSVPETDLIGSFVLAMILAEGDGGVKAANEDIILVRAAMEVEEFYRPFALLLLGKSDRAREVFKEIDSSTIGSFRDGWYRRLLAYGQGEMTAEELIATCDHPRPSHFNRCEGHFFVGMMLLSEGRHLEADEHFEKSVETGVFIYRDHELARAILEKRKADPQWPAWIPARQEPSTSEVNSPSPLAPKSE